MTMAPILPGMPVDADGPVFAEPWQARAFAMTVSLHQRGLFSWGEWAAALAAVIAADPDAPYYDQWLTALEGLVASKQLASPALLAATGQAWERAAARTPHGQPIELDRGDI